MAIPNLDEFFKKQAKGLVWVLAVDANPDDPDATTSVVVSKKFSATDGARVDDEVIGVTAKELTSARTALVTQLTQLDAFIEVCANAKKISAEGKANKP